MNGDVSVVTPGWQVAVVLTVSVVVGVICDATGLWWVGVGYAAGLLWLMVRTGWPFTA